MNKLFISLAVRLGLLLCGGLSACQPAAPQLPAPGRIFSKGRKFTYRVTHLAPATHRLRLDTVAITCLGNYKVGQYDTTQRKLGYSYDATSPPQSFPGVLENDSTLWCHPPRDGDYAILELSPFPFVKLPARAGQQWQWQLEVGTLWANPRWATWQGLLAVTSNYRTVRQQQVSTPMGQLTCWLVQAKATCQQGFSTLDLLYHPAYGFVQLHYRTIDGGQLTMDLVSANTIRLPEPDEFLPGTLRQLGPQRQGY